MSVFSPYLWSFDDNLNGLFHIESSRRNVRLFIIVIIIFFSCKYYTPKWKKKRNFVLTAMFPKFYIKINLLFAMKTPNVYIIFFNFLYVFIKFTVKKFQIEHFNFERYLYYLICRIYYLTMSTLARHNIAFIYILYYNINSVHILCTPIYLSTDLVFLSVDPSSNNTFITIEYNIVSLGTTGIKYCENIPVSPSLTKFTLYGNIETPRV